MSTPVSVTKLQAKSHDSPDEVRTADKTRVEIVRYEGITIGRFNLEPGWRWSECIKPVVNTDLCQLSHVGCAVSGQQAFHDIESAIEAGWETPLSPCVVHPQLGGMGYHYGRMEFFDGRINHREPQVLLYEPHQNEELEFVGVEYIVPFNIIAPDADPPVLFDQHYHANHDLGFWALHVWTEKENPGGMFTDFNPNVSCQFAND